MSCRIGLCQALMYHHNMTIKYPKVKFIAMTLLDTFSRGLLQSGELSGIIRLAIVRDPGSYPSPLQWWVKDFKVLGFTYVHIFYRTYLTKHNTITNSHYGYHEKKKTMFPNETNFSVKRHFQSSFHGD